MRHAANTTTLQFTPQKTAKIAHPRTRGAQTRSTCKTLLSTTSRNSGDAQIISLKTSRPAPAHRYGSTHPPTRRHWRGKPDLFGTRFAGGLYEPHNLIKNERGAVTAEYAIVIMAAVAFAGLLVAIMRSGEIRAMLVKLVENALQSAG